MKKFIKTIKLIAIIILCNLVLLPLLWLCAGKMEQLANKQPVKAVNYEAIKLK